MRYRLFCHGTFCYLLSYSIHNSVRALNVLAGAFVLVDFNKLTSDENGVYFTMKIFPNRAASTISSSLVALPRINNIDDKCHIDCARQRRLLNCRSYAVEYLPIATAVSRVGNDIICFRAANAHVTFAAQTRTLFDEPTGCITVF